MLQSYKQPYLLTICSGKGGVGKSVLTANIAYQLAAYKQKVLVIDADLTFPNQHLMFGIEPNLRIDDWLFGRADIDRVICEVAPNLSLVAGAVGNIETDLQNYVSCIDLYHSILQETDFDFILIDANAGISNHLVECASISDKIAIVITDEPTSIIDAYALIKILKEYADNRKMNLIVNNIIDDDDANEIIQKINKATQHFLKMSIDILGIVNYDANIKKSIIAQELLSVSQPETSTVSAFKKIADALIAINSHS